MPKGINKETGHGNYFQDHTGRVFGRLKVKKYAGKNKHGNSNWHCLCSCGTKCVVLGCRLTCGATTSCGCRLREVAARLAKTLGKQITHGCARHGKHRAPEYTLWAGMLQRCTNPNHSHWKSYGGNTPPVHVCRRWRSFNNFLADMGPRPKGTTLSRFADTGDYRPGNCVWHTWKQQREEARKKRLTGGRQ